jgi:hypothetical protein
MLIKLIITTVLYFFIKAIAFFMNRIMGFML